MLWFLVFAAVLLAALALTVISYCAAFRTSPRRREDIYDIPSGEQYAAKRDVMVALIGEMAALPYEEVHIVSDDGTPLFGRYYHVRDGAPLQIQMHGWRGSGIRDFCGGNKLAREAGFNTLVADQRGQGRSGGTVMTFGIRERYDCLAWARWAAERFPGTPVVLAGVSMGASAVLMAAGLELPETVVGVIADSPYSSPVDIIKKVCRDVHLPAGLIFPFIDLSAKLFGRFDLGAVTAAEAVRRSKLPILIIHGEDDRFVPCEMSQVIHDACPDRCTRVTFPGAGHGISYIADPERYARAVETFLRERVGLKGI